MWLGTGIMNSFFSDFGEFRVEQQNNIINYISIYIISTIFLFNSNVFISLQMTISVFEAIFLQLIEGFP